MKILLAFISLAFSLSVQAEKITCIAKLECSTAMNTITKISDSDCESKNITRSDLKFDFDNAELIIGENTMKSRLKKITNDIFLTGDILVYNFSQDKKLMIASVAETNDKKENTSFMITYECH